MFTTTRRYVAALALSVALCAPAVIHADTFFYGNQGFSVGSGWSNGGDTLYLLNAGSGQYTIEWSGTGWDSYGRDYSGSGYCCGYGTHQVQSTWGSSGSEVFFTNDGNLLMLDNSGSTVLWQTSTGSNWGGFLDLQNDHNMVVRTSGGTPLWSLF